MPEPAPRVAIVLTAYNQAPYVRDAVRSVLAQEHPPLEIILSDDGSRDDSFAIIEQEAAGYRGPHRVLINHNPATLGSAHIPSLLPRLAADIIIHAHGDDVALPHRALSLVDALTRSGAALVSSNAEIIDRDGALLGQLMPGRRSRRIGAEEIIRQSWQRTMLGASFAMRRTVYDRFRPIDETMPPVADHVLPFRAALLGGVAYVGAPLLRYRRHGTNMSAVLATGSVDPRPTEEILDTRHLEAFAWMWDDFVTFRASENQPVRDEIGRLLRQRIAWQTRKSIAERRAIESAGWRPVWIDRAAAEARPLPASAQIRAAAASRAP